MRTTEAMLDFLTTAARYESGAVSQYKLIAARLAALEAVACAAMDLRDSWGVELDDTRMRYLIMQAGRPEVVALEKASLALKATGWQPDAGGRGT